MTCALCHLERPRVSSHIIPEFLDQKLYDSRHRFHRISTAPQTKNQLLQKGLRERLLCRDCEQRLSDWGQYASQALSTISLEDPTEGSKSFIAHFDYAKFKLFQLSILWRTGVSRRCEFRQVQLGPHEEHLRAMLLAGPEPAKSIQASCSCCSMKVGRLTI